MNATVAELISKIKAKEFEAFQIYRCTLMSQYRADAVSSWHYIRYKCRRQIRQSNSMTAYSTVRKGHKETTWFMCQSNHGKSTQLRIEEPYLRMAMLRMPLCALLATPSWVIPFSASCKDKQQNWWRESGVMLHWQINECEAKRLMILQPDRWGV